MDDDPYLLPSIAERSNLGRIARGFDVGDPPFDALPTSSLQSLVRGLSPDVCGTDSAESGAENATDCHLLHMKLPHWADAEQLRRGQQVFRSHCLYFMRAFEVALLWGCRIDRFADVLVRSGYTSSPRVAFRRFRDTARHVFLWCCDEQLAEHTRSDQEINALNPNISCAALRSIFKVRGAHALARRRVQDAGACSVGTPVSQYDLALTLMAFSVIALESVVNDFGQPLTAQEIEDFLFLWRTLGWLHGVKDEFNTCLNPNDALEIMKDTNEAFFFNDVFDGREASRKLTLTVFEGFSIWGSGMGRDLLGAVYLRPLHKKLFVAFESIYWIPAGRALAVEEGNEMARRRVHVACAMNNGFLALLSRFPRLEKAIQRRYYAIVKWGLVEENISVRRAERGLRCMSMFHDAVVVCLAHLLGPLGLVGSTIASKEGELSQPRPKQTKDERLNAFQTWRNSFRGFQYTGQVLPLTNLSIVSILCRLGLAGGCIVMLLIAVAARSKAIRSRRSKSMAVLAPQLKK